MTDETRASLETPQDAGKGPRGVHRRWMLAIDLTSREEEHWRKEAKGVVEAYRDERDYRPNERKGASRFNILWCHQFTESEIET